MVTKYHFLRFWLHGLYDLKCIFKRFPWFFLFFLMTAVSDYQDISGILSCNAVSSSLECQINNVWSKQAGLDIFPFKVHIFWEGHKILRNLHRRFVLWSNGQIYGGDFAKFCGLFRIYELYLGENRMYELYLGENHMRVEIFFQIFRWKKTCWWKFVCKKNKCIYMFIRHSRVLYLRCNQLPDMIYVVNIVCVKT